MDVLPQEFFRLGTRACTGEGWYEIPGSLGVPAAVVPCEKHVRLFM